MANNRYVVVNITRKTQATTEAGFSTPLLVSLAASVPYELMNSSNAVQRVGTLFGTNSAEYKSVVTMLQQSPRVSQIAIMGVLPVSPSNGSSELVEALGDLDSDYFYLVTTSRSPEVIRALAQFNETQDRIFVFATDDADAVTNISTYTKTVGMYHTLADTESIDAALVGYVAPREVGTYSIQFKSLVGITPDRLTQSEIDAIEAKNLNCYIMQSGQSMISESKTASGEYLDNVQVTLWLQARITEAVFNLLTTTPKIPYTIQGLDLVGHTISMVFENTPDGMLATDESGNVIYSVNVPTLAEIPRNDVMNRVLNDVTFTADVAGAIKKITIDGTLYAAS